MFTGYIAGNAYQIDAQRNQRVAVTRRPRRTRVFLRMRSLDGIASADDVGESATEVSLVRHILERVRVGEAPFPDSVG